MGKFDELDEFKQARKLQATLEDCNLKLCLATDSLTGLKCRATSLAKNATQHDYKILTQPQLDELGELDALDEFKNSHST